MHRQTSSGNIFLALFGAVAVAGLVGASLSNVMKGPLKSSIQLTRQNSGEAQMALAGRSVVMAAASLPNTGDCDADGIVEPWEWRVDAALPKPIGGGLVPDKLLTSNKDPWGTDYGYCVWDHGTKVLDTACRTGASNARLAGSNIKSATTVAIISAGADKKFSTTCRTFAAADVNSNGVLGDTGDLAMVSKAASSDDDMILSFTYTEAVGVSGGLWSLKPADPATAIIAKDLEITGGASFTETGLFQSIGQSVSGGGPANCAGLGGTYYNDPVSGNCYYRGTGTAGWAGAKINCEAQGAFLATITSSAEQALIEAQLVPTGNTWIGGTAQTVASEWRWGGGPENNVQFWQGASTGSAVSGAYANWATGEPSVTNTCMVIDTSKSNKWRSAGSCTSGVNYICEKSGVASTGGQLDVESGLKLATPAAMPNCNATNKGSARQTSDGAGVEICDGAAWKALGGGAVGPAELTIFVTDAVYTSNLGGISGANATCQAAAVAANLPSGTYKAWLSDAATSPSANFYQSTTPYKNTNGVTVANNWADLIDGTLAQPILSETKASVTGEVWTLTAANGTAAAFGNCLNWTGGTGTTGVGVVGSLTSTWTAKATASACSGSSRLYCVAQTAPASVNFPLKAPDGSYGAPSYSFANSASSGMYYSSSALNLTSAGTVEMKSAGQVTMQGATTDFRVSSNGGLQVGNDTATCDSTIKGTIRFISGTNKFEYCDGTTWSKFTGSDCPGGGGTKNYVMPGTYTFTPPAGSETCTFTVTVKGGGGGGSYNTDIGIGGRGGGITFSFIPGAIKPFDILVGGSGVDTDKPNNVGGYGGGGGGAFDVPSSRYFASGGGASAIKYDNKLLAIAGGGGGGQTSAIGGAGGPRLPGLILSGSAGAGSGDDPGKGGDNNVGGAGGFNGSYVGGAGGNNGANGGNGTTYTNGGTGVPAFLIGGGGGGAKYSTTTNQNGAGGGGGYGGGGGGARSGTGGGGGGYFKTGTPYTPLAGYAAVTGGAGGTRDSVSLLPIPAEGGSVEISW